MKRDISSEVVTGTIVLLSSNLFVLISSLTLLALMPFNLAGAISSIPDLGYSFFSLML